MKLDVVKFARRAGFVVNEMGMIAVRRKHQLYYCTLEIETLVRALEKEIAGINQDKLDNYDWLMVHCNQLICDFIDKSSGFKESNAHAAIYAARTLGSKND